MPQGPELTPDQRDDLDRLEILEAIAVATAHPHEVVDVLLGAADASEARRALGSAFDWSENQARAVLDQQFRRVTQLERRKLETARSELAARVRARQ